MIHRIQAELPAVFLSHVLAVCGTAVVWAANLDTAAKWLVVVLDLVIGCVTVSWLLSKRRKVKGEESLVDLERRKLELEIARLEDQD